MERRNAVAISVAAGVAALAGTVAATKTIALSHPSSSRPQPTAAAVTARAQALDRLEISLRKALARRPPALPPLPTTPAAAAQTAPPTAAVASPPRQAEQVVYVRPAPRIVTVHRAGGEHESGEAEGDSHGEAAEGGFDD